MATVQAKRPPSITYALTRALKVVYTGPEHAPTVALAKRYAAMLDEDPDRLARLGRAFLAVLVELRMTPRARAGVLGGGWPEDDEPGAPLPAAGEEGGASNDGDSGADEFDELRTRRDRRQHHAAAVD